MSQSAGPSRPSKTNPADRENAAQRAQLGRSLSAPLTERDGVRLREEAVRQHTYGADAETWREVVRRWQDYIRESGETAAVFENARGDRVEGSTPNRFHPDYSAKQYAKLKDLERGLRGEYGKRLHTAMLTLTASSTDEDGEPLPPADHLDGPEGLLSSWSAVTRALRRVMEGRRYERLAILEPHKSGYVHVHIAVFVDGVVSRETFRPVIEAHLRNCDRAGEEAHDLDDDSTVSVNHVGDDRDAGQLENLGTYLAEYLGTYGEDPLEAEDHVQASNALLWVTEKRRWRPSNGAQSYMATNQKGDEFTEWEFVGIRDGAGDLHECGSGGGVRRAETFSIPPPGGGDDPDEPPGGSSEWGTLSGDRGHR